MDLSAAPRARRPRLGLAAMHTVLAGPHLRQEPPRPGGRRRPGGAAPWRSLLATQAAGGSSRTRWACCGAARWCGGCRRPGSSTTAATATSSGRPGTESEPVSGAIFTRTSGSQRPLCHRASCECVGADGRHAGLRPAGAGQEKRPALPGRPCAGRALRLPPALIEDSFGRRAARPFGKGPG